jgi:hypothetical protein
MPSTQTLSLTITHQATETFPLFVTDREEEEMVELPKDIRGTSCLNAEWNIRKDLLIAHTYVPREYIVEIEKRNLFVSLVFDIHVFFDNDYTHIVFSQMVFFPKQ